MLISHIYPYLYGLLTGVRCLARSELTIWASIRTVVSTISVVLCSIAFMGCGSVSQSTTTPHTIPQSNIADSSSHTSLPETTFEPVAAFPAGTLHSQFERYVPLDSGGQPLASVPSNGKWPCVMDRVTQLIWEVKSLSSGLQSIHNSYTWSNFQPNLHSEHDTQNQRKKNRLDGNNPMKDDTQSNDQAGLECTGNCNTADYIDAINAIQLCGLNHWRLPTRAELKSLVEYSIPYPGPTIDQAFFPHTSSQFYWSSTPDTNDGDSAWGVGFSFGYDYAYFKSDFGRVRLVHDTQTDQAPKTPTLYKARGEQRCHEHLPVTTPVANFIDNQDGTITDIRHGLMWLRCTVGQRWEDSDCVGKVRLNSYQYFTQAVRQFQLGGYKDWRIPTITELDSITELSCEGPAINLDWFPATVPGNYWSATPFINDPNRQWLVQFASGENHVELRSASALVRYVRDILQ